MRNPGSVYRKLKEIKYRYLILLYRKYLKKIPENCVYHHVYQFRGVDGKDYELPVCLVHQSNKDKLDLNLIDVCLDNRHSNQCNAFVYKYTKEDIKEIMEKELKDKNTRDRKYPEISALEWVLERSVAEIPVLNCIQKAYFNTKRIISKNKIL